MPRDLHSYFGRCPDGDTKSKPKPAQNKKPKLKLNHPESDEEPIPMNKNNKKRKIIKVLSDDESHDFFVKKSNLTSKHAQNNLNFNNINNNNICNNINNNFNDNNSNIRNRACADQNLKPIDPAEYFLNAINNSKKRKIEINNNESIFKKLNNNLNINDNFGDLTINSDNNRKIPNDSENIFEKPICSENLRSIPNVNDDRTYSIDISPNISDNVRDIIPTLDDSIRQCPMISDSNRQFLSVTEDNRKLTNFSENIYENTSVSEHLRKVPILSENSRGLSDINEHVRKSPKPTENITLPPKLSEIFRENPRVNENIQTFTKYERTRIVPTKPEMVLDVSITSEDLREIMNTSAVSEDQRKNPENTKISEKDPGSNILIDNLIKKIDIEKINSSSSNPRQIYSNIEKLSYNIQKNNISKNFNTTKIEARQPKNDTLWVDKYKPTVTSDIVGQNGANSPANKLRIWLQRWENSRKVKKNFFQAKEDGSAFKAALISGPPGIGKSTTAVLVCKELRLDIVEMNASDQRNKKCLETMLSVSLQNVRIGQSRGGKSVLIMDEVDGMSGNEDRGGIQEIIMLIKSTQIPVICICNDRMHQKIRSLANHCFDLRFYRPRIENIRTFINKVSIRENISIDSTMVDQLITASNNDIRSILNNLQLFSLYKSDFSSNVLKSCPPLVKDTNENIFDITKKIFNKIDPVNFSLMDKNNLFFMDYSLVPLFIQENYLSTNRNNLNVKNNYKNNLNIYKAGDCIGLGDICDKNIKSTNNWSLLSTYAILSSVLPSEYAAGSFKGMINFPQFLGKTSNTNKNKRIIQEFVHHSHLKSSLSNSAYVLDFLPYFKPRFYSPLVEESSNDFGVKKVISLLEDYDLTKDDWDSMVELYQWTNLKIPIIQTKTKSAMTRMINKLDRSLPYSISTGFKTKSDSFEENESGEEEISTEKSDPMVKMVSTPANVKKPKQTRKVKTK